MKELKGYSSSLPSHLPPIPIPLACSKAEASVPQTNSGCVGWGLSGEVRAGFWAVQPHLVSINLKQTNFSDWPQELSDSLVSWLSCSFVSLSSTKH